MKKLLQAAALALSALGSLFTNVDAPKARDSSIQPRTAVVVEAPKREARAPVASRDAGSEAQMVFVVFGGREDLFDIDKHVLLKISGAPSVKAPVDGAPWYIEILRELQKSTVAARAAKPVVALDAESDGSEL